MRLTAGNLNQIPDRSSTRGGAENFCRQRYERLLIRKHGVRHPTTSSPRHIVHHQLDTNRSRFPAITDIGPLEPVNIMRTNVQDCTPWMPISRVPAQGRSLHAGSKHQIPEPFRSNAVES